MSSNRNRLPDDWQEIFINRVRSSGVWCDVSEKDTLRHFFVSRNPKASVAISLCGQIVRPFEVLHENHVKQKCLICDLYQVSSKEVQEKILQRTEGKLEQSTETQTKKQEYIQCNLS